MKPIVHVGPSKTASKTVQAAIIPKMGRPYQIKPDWAKHIARGEQTQLPESVRLQDGPVISHELLGDFMFTPAPIVAQRLWETMGPVIVIFVRRPSVSRFISFYRQSLLHLALSGAQSEPMTADETFDRAIKECNTYGAGILTSFDMSIVSKAFSKFDLQFIDFGLLKNDFSAFAQSFFAAAQIPYTEIKEVRKNEARKELFDFGKSRMKTKLVDLYRAHYLNPVLSKSRREILATFDDGF